MEKNNLSPQGDPLQQCVPKNYFGQALKEIRIEKNLTQERAADLLQITQAQWSSYELGKSRPNLDMIIAIAKAIKINPFDLLRRSLLKSHFFSPTAFEDYNASLKHELAEK